MREQRTCGACGGRGVDTVWPGAPLEWCQGWTGDGRFISCPACDGRGTVDATASRADALADAETLRRFLRDSQSARATHQSALYRLGLGVENAETFGGRVRWRGGRDAGFVRDQAVNAARAAFRAVPGLRG